jgi:Inhibitor of apoptosis-promoting Bax1
VKGNSHELIVPSDGPGPSSSHEARPGLSRRTFIGGAADFDAVVGEDSRRERHIMDSGSSALRPALTRDEAGTLFGQTMGLVAVTAGMFAVGAWLGRNLAYQWGWLLFIAAFACLIGMNVAAQRSEGLTVTLLFGFGVLIGLAVAPTLSYYASADPQAVWQAGGATALFIAGFGAAGYATRRDLSGLARVLFWASSAFAAATTSAPPRCSRPRSSSTSSTCSFCCCRSLAAARIR